MHKGGRNGLMLKVCVAGKPLRSLIKATSEHTMPFLSPSGWSISPFLFSATDFVGVHQLVVHLSTT